MELDTAATTLTRVPVLVRATDPILQGGVAVTLRTRPEVRLVDEDDAEARSAVVFVVADRLDDHAVKLLRTLQCGGHSKVALIAGQIDDNEILTAVENGVCAVARRSEVSADALVRLAQAVVTGDGALPPDLLGRLLDRVARLQRNVLEPRGLHLGGTSARETEVLRLVAEGFSTKEIAEQLCYSQRTVKAIMHDITNRFHLRNRPHAVAYALREGII
jgi:DNA-binding NarL/FixJ family response regulator